MVHKPFILIVAFAMAGLMAACGDNNDAEYTEMDRTWDASDSAFLMDYNAVRASYDSTETNMKAMPASDDKDAAMAAKRAEMQTKFAANRQSLQDIEARRTAARAMRDSARNSKDKAAYEAARKQADADYAAWKADLDRLRAERMEMEGMIKIGDKSVGGVDVNLKDTNKPLLRVEPGKEDDKPLIELNKNPK